MENQRYKRYKVVLTDPSLPRPNATYPFGADDREEAESVFKDCGPNQGAVLYGSPSSNKDDWEVIDSKPVPRHARPTGWNI